MEICSDCPPLDYPTDKTRCAECPRGAEEWKCAGCGVSGPDRFRRCKCTTNVIVMQRGDGRTFTEWKRDQPNIDTIRRLGESVGGIRTPRMEGDNLAVILCSYFDNPDQAVDDELGWTPDAVAGCDEVLAAIRLHYETCK